MKFFRYPLMIILSIISIQAISNNYLNHLEINSFANVADFTIGDSCDSLMEKWGENLAEMGDNWFSFNFDGESTFYCDEKTMLINKIVAKSKNSRI